MPISGWMGNNRLKKSENLGSGGKADDLTNEAFGNFSLALRSATSERPLDQLPWKILPQLVEAAAQLQRELAAKKAVKLTLAEDVKPMAHKRNKRKSWPSGHGSTASGEAPRCPSVGEDDS